MYEPSFMEKVLCWMGVHQWIYGIKVQSGNEVQSFGCWLKCARCGKKQGE